MLLFDTRGNNMGVKEFIDSVPEELKQDFEKISNPYRRFDKDYNLGMDDKRVSEFIKIVLDSPDLSEKEKVSFIDEIWDNTEENVQKKQLNSIIKLLEDNKAIDEKIKLNLFTNIWRKTSKEVQKDNIKLFDKLIKEVKEYKESEELEDDFISPGLVARSLLLFTRIIDSKEDFIKEIWGDTAKEIQNKKLGEIITIIEESAEIKGKGRLVGEIWHNTVKDVKISNKDTLGRIIEIVGNGMEVEGDGYIISNIWASTPDEVKKEKPEVLDQIIRIAENKLNVGNMDRAIEYIWEGTPPEIQKVKIKSINNMVKYSKTINDNMKLSIIMGIWEETGNEVQKENSEVFSQLIEMVENNPDLNNDDKAYRIEGIWEATVEEIQKENIEVLNQLIDNVINDEKLNFIGKGRKLRDLWGATTAEVQKDNPGILCKIIKNLDEADRANWIANVWESTKIETREEIEIKVIEEILKGNEKDDVSIVSDLYWWINEKGTKTERLSKIIDTLANNKDIKEIIKSEALMKMWGNTPQEVQQNNSKELSKIVNIIDSAPNIEKIGMLCEVWKNTTADGQKNNPDIFDRLIEIIENNADIDDKARAYALKNIWVFTKENIQVEKLEAFNRIRKNIMDNPNLEEKTKISIGERLWMNSTAKVQAANLGMLNDLVKRMLESVNIEYKEIGTIWRETAKDIQKDNISKIFKEVDDNPDMESYVKEILAEQIWSNTDKEVQSERIINLIDLLHDSTDLEDESKAMMIDSILNNTNKNALNAEICNALWDKMTPDLQKKHFETFINVFCKNQEANAKLPDFLRKINEEIDAEKLTELLTMKDNEYISKLMVNEIIGKSVIDNSDIDIEKINQEIETTHNMFLTDNLPEAFKLFTFFKYHEYNHSSHNTNLYSDEISNEARDKIMIKDLFKASLDSGNRQLENFMEILYNGDIAFNKKSNYNTLDENEYAMLYSYRDTLFDLYKIYGDEKLERTSDIYADIDKLRVTMRFDKGENIGENILFNFLKEIDFDLENYDKGNGQPIYETLLEHMREARKDALERNKANTNVNELLQKGDIIKGTDIEFLDTQLRLGIRSKEFYMKGYMESDCTPFDTDFSEITDYNIEEGNGNLGGIIETTVSNGYGETFYVIKKGDYDENRSYTSGDEQRKTRYLRTAIGSNAISCIITSQWSDEYAYTMAQNGIYIPVVDTESQELVFTYEQYSKIREGMKGLSFYRTDDFEIDENVFNPPILAEAEEMRKQANGTISTEEKRSKIIALIEKTLPKKVAQDMIGNISGEVIEFIDTGSTGRGTNIPGDGDFDFMLKCANKDEQARYIDLLKKAISGEEKGGTNEFNIRYEDVNIEGLETPVDIDITSETKKLELEYSSDLCVRDRLNGIKEKYGEEALSKVVDNILVAKKTLKEVGLYKKTGSKGATELGGFGGIGVENWILQNGGSFVLAMETFLDSTRDENGKEIGFEEFKKKYPIYDFGQNHRNNMSHDHFIEGLTKEGFDQMKEKFPEVLKEYGIEYEFKPEGHSIAKNNFGEAVRKDTKEAEYMFSDIPKMKSMFAKFKAFMKGLIPQKAPEMQVGYEE